MSFNRSFHNDKPDRGTAEPYGRDGTGITGKRQTASVISGAEPEFADIKQRVIRTAESFARYRRTAFPDRTAEKHNRTVGNRESAMAGINAEAEQREQLIAETEQRITDLKQQIEKVRDIDARMRKLRERRSRWLIVLLFSLILSAMLRYSRLCFRCSISRSRSAIRLSACSVPKLSGLSDPVRPASVLSSAKVLPPARRDRQKEKSRRRSRGMEI